MNQELTALRETVIATVKNAEEENGWALMSRVGQQLSAASISYKNYGFFKLIQFLNEFSDDLECRNVIPGEGQPPVACVRVKTASDGEMPRQTVPENPAPAPMAPPAGKTPARKNPKVPNVNTRFYDWAILGKDKIRELSELALEELWYYEGQTAGATDLPILRNYLTYTFKRLAYEKKIRFCDGSAPGEEFAAFNTGLVDRKYEYIYALFRNNTKPDRPHYWYLVDFAVAGEENAGKTLVRYFNPLPAKADYFEGKIENMLYDTSTGELMCDYTHILIERASRFPLEFLEDNGPALSPEEREELAAMHVLPDKDPAKKAYFAAYGKRISEDMRALNRMKNRVEDAVELAQKRVEWNYKTAIPMYYPARNSVSLLLPLALITEDRIDLALIIERQPSGAYQGQTVLPLYMAYCDSRLVTRPDSDWLRTDIIESGDEDED